MTDITELVKRLRDRDAPDGTVGWAHATYPPQKVKDALCNQAADALEAQEKKIEYLKEQLRLTNIDWCIGEARIAELEAALMNKRDVTLEEAALEIERVGHSEYPNKLITDGYAYAVRSLKGMPRAAERTSAALKGEK